MLVTGLAGGIDEAAFRGAVAAPGRGAAVLRCGRDVAHPREQASLRDEGLPLGGAIVAANPSGGPPEAWRFPPRNRITAGSARAAGCCPLIRGREQAVLDPVDLITELQLILRPGAMEPGSTLVRAEMAGTVVCRGDGFYPSVGGPE